MHMPYDVALRVIAKGREKESDERLWSQYVSLYPYMNQDNFMTFEDFKKECVKPIEPKISKTEILNEVEDIIGMTI